MAVPVISESDCTGCEACVDECPVEAITMVDGLAVINAGECTECNACIDVCPAEAISEG